MLLLAVNVPAHKASRIITFVWDYGYESCPTSLFSWPGTFKLLPVSKYEEPIRGKSSKDYEELITVVASWFDSKFKDFYEEDIKGLFHIRLTVCDLRSGYVEKEESVNPIK